MSDDRQAKHVFVSYVREDRKEVDRLCDELKRHGVKVWLDRDDIKPGSRWKDAVREAIHQGDFFIACFSKAYSSRRRNYMNQEVVLAIQVLAEYPTDRAWFIPVLLEECDVPARSIGGIETLLDIQWVPLYADWDNGVRRILGVIQPIPVEVQRLAEALHSGDTPVRIAAVRALCKRDRNKAVKILVDFLNDRNPLVRIITAEVLRSLGEDEDTIEKLGNILPVYPDSSSKKYIRFPIFPNTPSEERYYTEIMRGSHGSLTRAARKLGVHRVELYQKLTSLGIDSRRFQ